MRRGRHRWRGFGFLAVFLFAAGCGGETEPLTWSGTVEFPDVEVGSLVGGRVARVLKDEGDAATAGETLLELDPAEWQSALEEARALAEATSRELALLVAGPRKEDIARAEAEAKRMELLWQVTAQGSRPEEVQAAREEVHAAEADLEEKEKEVHRLEPLVEKRVEPQASLDRAVSARDVALAKKAAAEQRVQLLEKGLRPEEVEAARQAWLAEVERVKALEAGSRPEEIAAKRSQLDAAKARIAAAEVKVSELEVKAPRDAFVQTLDVRPGDLLQAGAPVGVLLLREKPWIVVYVPEADLAKVTVGQRATIRPDGHPPLPGHVVWVSRRAEYTPRNVQTREDRVTQVFAVKIVIEGDASRLKDGMWADVHVE